MVALLAQFLTFLTKSGEEHLYIDPRLLPVPPAQNTPQSHASPSPASPAMVSSPYYASPHAQLSAQPPPPPPHQPALSHPPPLGQSFTYASLFNTPHAQMSPSPASPATVSSRYYAPLSAQLPAHPAAPPPGQSSACASSLLLFQIRLRD